MFGVFDRGNPKIGLALGGGGARGFSHLGALKAFEEFGIKFDYVAGTSAGSVVGACYSAGMTFEEIYRSAKEIKEKEIRTNKIPFFPSKTEGIENLMKKTVGDINIEDLKIPFSAVAVDLKSTKEVCISKGNLAKAVAGSCCVPGVFTPVEFNDMLLCDGGLQNTIPADIPRFFGCDYVIAIDCHKTRGYGTDSAKIVDVLTCAIRILMKGNAVKGYVNADVVIQPDTKRFKATRTSGIDEMIEEGYRATVDAIPKIKELIKKKPSRKRKIVSEKDEIIFI